MPTSGKRVRRKAAAKRIPAADVSTLLGAYPPVRIKKGAEAHVGHPLVEVSDRGTITLPKAFRGSRLFEVQQLPNGTIALVPQHTVPASQAWFWSERWQRMEREADADIAAGRVEKFDSADALLGALDKL